MPGAVSLFPAERRWSLRSRCDLAPHLVESKVFLGDDGKKFRRRDQLLGAVQGVLEHRPFADEVDVLLRQMIGASAVNPVSQSRAIPA